MGLSDTRTKQLNASPFWNLIVPFMILLILLFIIFVVFTMPDWALDCKTDLLPVRKLAESISKNSSA
jgi:hypothetical protein